MKRLYRYIGAFGVFLSLVTMVGSTVLFANQGLTSDGYTVVLFTAFIVFFAAATLYIKGDSEEL